MRSYFGRTKIVAELVYVLCAVTSVVCAILLLRGYAASRTRLLLWASVCFLGLALNNVLLLIDLTMLPDIDLFWWRTVPAIAGMLILLYGLIWEFR
jgi:Family of unknown function (DUF5985)